MLAVFVTSFSIAAGMLWLTRDHHLGVHEDHFDKGVALYETGSMSAGKTPMVFRPPGYPVFVAATLLLRDAVLTIAAPLSGGAPLRVGRREAALAAHAALLGVLAATVFWFLVRHTGTLVAGLCAIAVGCNPALVILAGHVSYELFHLVLVTIATLLMLKWSADREPNSAGMFGHGLLWGVISLVKSVTLIVPVFILIWTLLRSSVRKATLATAFFSLGMIVVVAPYTIRNYAVTGRFIPVNQQASFAFWGTSLERIPEGQRYLQWVSMWFRNGMKTYTEVTGAADYTIATFEDHVLELSDRFSVLAADNLRRNPAIYAYNASRNAVSFLTDQPTSYYFALYQWPRDAGMSRLVAGLPLMLMSLVGLIAAIVGALRRDQRWSLVVLLFVMMWAAHTLTFLEARYLYVKVPTIVTAFVLACTAMAASRNVTWRRGATIFAATTASLSIAGLFML